jgi:peptidoglycan/LPS O-acetylase OafA/YrhL
MHLIHQAVGYFCFGLLTRDIIHFTNWKIGAVGILSIVITYLIACVSWKYFDQPLLQVGHRNEILKGREFSSRYGLAVTSLTSRNIPAKPSRRMVPS